MEEPGLGRCDTTTATHHWEEITEVFPLQVKSRQQGMTDVVYWTQRWGGSEAARQREPSPVAWFLHKSPLLCFTPAYLRPERLRGVCA